MNRVLFLQLKGKTYGGVWQVNKIVGEELIKNGYEASVVSLRDNHENIIIEHDERLKLYTINEKEPWSTYRLAEIKQALKGMKILKVINMILSRIRYEIILKQDIKKLHKYIYTYNPNYIITSHYQLLDMIPKEYLPMTINEQHTSFKEAISNRATKKTFIKYKDKVTFLWLTKKTMQDAIEFGITNSHYIYNAVRIKSNKKADVIKNKKLITISRISYQKNIPLMVEIAKDIFKDKNLKDWCLEIYGHGEEEELVKKIIKNHNQIRLMGPTTDVKEKLLNASINLNTSRYEGFSLSILEANECGVPTITLNFGESVSEEIIDNKTGIIAKDKEEYIEKLKKLMIDKKQLKELSTNSKEYNENFQIEKIIKDWINLFKIIDENNKEK